MVDLNKLNMTHLSEEASDTDLRDQVVEATPEVVQKKAPAKDPRDAVSYVFPFRYEDERGRVFSATFTNEILTIQDKMRVGALESSFNAGAPIDSIDEETRVVNRGIAWMTFSLKARANQKPAGWADNFRKLRDNNLILALFAEVSAHEGIFHGRIESEEPGQGEAGDASAAP